MRRAIKLAAWFVAAGLAVVLFVATNVHRYSDGSVTVDFAQHRIYHGCPVLLPKSDDCGA